MAEAKTKVIKLSIADVWLDENQIVHTKYNQTDVHGLDEAKEVTKAHDALVKGRIRPCLADLRDVKVGADKAARNHYASDAVTRSKSALAMVTNSRAQRTFGAIYLFLTRPPYPTKLFKSKSEAIEWLSSFTSCE